MTLREAKHLLIFKTVISSQIFIEKFSTSFKH